MVVTTKVVKHSHWVGLVNSCGLHVYLVFKLVCCCLSFPFNCLDMCTCDRLWSWELTRTPWTAHKKHVPCCHSSAHGSGACCCVYGPRELLVLWSSSVVVIGWRNLFSWCINKRWSMKQERHELQFPNVPRNTEENWLNLGLETSWRRLRLMRSSMRNS